MYWVMVIGLMLVLPIASVLIEGFASGWTPDALALIGKWFVFWAMGVRLFLAGVSQIVRPSFTAQNILGNEANEGTNHVVQELGFANLAFGVVGIVAPWAGGTTHGGWTAAAALAGGVFLFAAGIRHIFKQGKGSKEWVACITDLLVGALLLVFAITSLVS
ncbi:hypothetical protein GCM10027568_25660 [Humibacter soli]